MNQKKSYLLKIDHQKKISKIGKVISGEFSGKSTNEIIFFFCGLETSAQREIFEIY